MCLLLSDSLNSELVLVLFFFSVNELLMTTKICTLNIYLYIYMSSPFFLSLGRDDDFFLRDKSLIRLNLDDEFSAVKNGRRKLICDIVA